LWLPGLVCWGALLPRYLLLPLALALLPGGSLRMQCCGDVHYAATLPPLVC
jgi:hypothetical protein